MGAPGSTRSAGSRGGSARAAGAPTGTTPEPGAGRTLGRLAAVGVFAFGLALRLAHVAGIRGAPFFQYPINDARAYDDWARRIAQGDWLGAEAFYQAPLYPYLLAVVYRVLGTDPLVLRVVQALVGAAACVLLAQATARVASRRAGVVAGLALAAYGPAIYYDGMIGKSVVDGFLLCLALFVLAGLVARGDPAPRARGWLALGLVLGALALTRENALVLPAALVAWLVLVPRGVGAPRRPGLRAAAWLAAGVFAALLPVALRNLAVAGELHVTTSQFGPNFYIGNNPSATGRYRALRLGRSDARYERADATALAEAATGRTLAPGEVSAYWTGRALAFIADDPVAWLALKGRVLGALFEATEWVDSEDLYTHAEYSRVLAATATVLHFGVVAPLAAFGVVATVVRPERRRRGTPFLWMATAYAATVVAFYVFGRYRYPLVPFAVMFAAVGATEVPALLRRGGWALAVACAAAVAVAATSNLQDPRRDHQQAVTAHNLGRALHRAGRLDEAEAQYRRAVALEPSAFLSETRLAELLQQRERHAEAVPHFERAAARWTSSGLPDLERGVSLEALGRLDDALAAYHRSAEREPDKPEPRVREGFALRALGRHDEALRSFERALALDPADARALAGSAWILAAHPQPERRDPAEAVRVAERAVARGGRTPALLDALAVAVAANGDTAGAARIAREAVERATRAGEARLAESIRLRLELYASGTAYADAAPE